MNKRNFMVHGSVPGLRVHGWSLICATCLLATNMGYAQNTDDLSQRRVKVEGAILKTIESTTLAAQVSGVLIEFNAKEGDRVQADQVLGKVRDEAIRLKLEQLKTQCALASKRQANDIDKRLAENARQVAVNEYQRALKANAIVPDTYPLNEIDRLKLVTDQTQLEVERAEHAQGIAALEVELAHSDYRQAFELYSRHQIVAPSAGVVVSLEKRKGEWVEPGMALLRIVRIDRLRVEGFVPAQNAMLDLVGRQATVRVTAEPNATSLQATVVFVSPDVNPVNSQVRIYLEVENDQKTLRPGLPVEAYVELAE